MINIDIRSKHRDYTIYIKNNAIDHIDHFLDINQHYVIITDDQIPTIYLDKIMNAIPQTLLIKIASGETSKSLSTYQMILSFLQTKNITKETCLIALGGGVVGDITGFVASTYLRGIDYIQIPTTLLAQVDASVGGKTGINFEKNKNVIGSIYPPKYVIIDPQTLNTLSNRHFNNGIAEVIKYGLISSKKMIETLEKPNVIYHITDLIAQSIEIKKKLIEQDEYDQNMRRYLNFGHTLGHAYESYYQFNKYLHGEAIAIGMLPMIMNQNLKMRITKLLDKYQLPTNDSVPIESLLFHIEKDKKRIGETYHIITIDTIGKPSIKEATIKQIIEIVRKGEE